MIEVTAIVGLGVTAIRVEGHEQHDGALDHAGVVCAAVTAVTRTALLGLEEFARMYPDQIRLSITDLHKE